MSVIAVIEVSNTDTLKAEHGEETYNMLHNELVERLRGWIRAQDQLVVDKSGRICALLKGLSEQGQINLAANKLKRVSTPLYDCFGEKIELPVTAGFALTLPSGDTREAALARAGAALSQASQNAKGWATYSAENNSIQQDELKLLAGLKRGLERGEFVLFFQPKVNAAYRSLIGAEALMRWIPDGKTIIGPDHFIAAAERHDLIKPLSLWAIKSAIARCARWQGDISVAVNLPPTVLEDDDLYCTVNDCLALHGIDASRLTLEVTESVMAENHADVLQTLTQLRSLGVRISIDDFGTGYSSLACFRDMPADELKIDKCFVQAMPDSKVDQAIVRTIIELAKNFSLQIVAEGVEDDSTANTLLDMGCHVLQGYLIDKPLPADDFEKRHQLTSG